MAQNHSDRAGFFRLRIRPVGLLTAAALLTGFASMVGFFGSLHWLADLCSHFRVQYVIALTGAAALLILFPAHRRMAAVIGLLAAVNLAVILPYYLNKPAAPAAAGSSLRALLLNVHTRLGDVDSVAAVIRNVDPDILVLEEVTSTWLVDLQPVLSRYPHSIHEAREDNFGIALFSKLSLNGQGAVEIGEAGVPSIFVEAQNETSQFTVLATHPLPPTSAAYSQWRNGQLAELPKWVQKAESPVLLLGDLNVTPWSPYFGRLLRDSNLIDSSRGRGLCPTWPSFLPLLRIPIDHCLHAAEIQIVARWRGPNVGSDHFPLVVDFVVAPGNRQINGTAPAP